MASSTSSSDPSQKVHNANERIGSVRWLHVFLLGLAVAFLALVLWEITLRTYGLVPRIRDSYGLWASEFFELLEQDENGVAVIGASRIMQAIDPDALSDELPDHRSSQLAKAGQSPVPVLDLLANETGFRGLTLVDITPRIFYCDDKESGKYIGDWLVELHNDRVVRERLSVPLASEIEQSISLPLQSRFVTAGADMTPVKFAKQLAKGERPEKQFVKLTARRQQVINYTGIDTEAFRASRVKLNAGAVPLDAEAFGARLAHVRELADKIIARGGTVVFVRLPSDGPVRATEKQLFPRPQFWDRVVAELPGDKIHCHDHPDLDNVTCTDGAHIDTELTAGFTQRLVKHLQGDPSP